DAGVVTVQVQPWGPPLAPFAAGVSVVQAAGTTGNYTRAAGHVCEVSAGFPGTTTQWQASTGSVSGVQLRVNGQPLPQTGQTLQVVSTDTCAAGTVQVTATNQTNSVSGPVAAFAIEIQAAPRPLADAGFTLSAGFAQGEISGSTDVPGLDCVADRNLSVDLRVERSAQVVYRETARPLGAYSLSGVPLNCAGDQVDVVAALSANGTASGKTARVTLPIPSQPVGLVGFAAQPLIAKCGETAKGAVALETGSFCATPAFSLRPTPGELGVQVRVQQAEGGTFLIETESTELDALLGKTASLVAFADGGIGNSEELPVSVDFTADPFLRVKRRASSVVVSSSAPVTYTVELTNTTDCDVSKVTYKELLNGRRYVEGSARVDGAAPTATSSGDALTVAAISIPARHTVRVSYSARVLPFASAQQTGEAFIGGTLISMPETTEASSGCGCQTPGNQLVPSFFALLVLVASKRRMSAARVRS
ncbi:MAG: hypothetical protein ACT4TC_20275, partial [Myxococcaceae bacterium]